MVLRFTFFLILIPAFVVAQGSSIRGALSDKQSNEPVIQAEVITLDETGTQVSASITDLDGIFLIEHLPQGTYTLTIRAFGYNEEVIHDVVISAEGQTRLRTLHMTPSEELLDEVEVSGQRPDALIGLDRKVYDVSSDINTMGGQAADVLQNIPSLTVDIDGAVSLRGSENVRIWIDGRPSTMLGMDDQTALQQIPASSIVRIEVITNPSARYDPDGTAGIINIVTRKETRNGWNGNLTAGVGTRDKYNASAFLSRREGNWTYFGSYGYNRNRRETWGYDSRDSYFGDTTLTLRNDEGGFSDNSSHNVRLGTDWKITDKDVLSLTGSWNHRVGNRIELAEYTNLTNHNPYDLSDRTVFSTRDRSSQDAALHYEKTTDLEDEKWIVNFSFSRSDDDDGQSLDWIYQMYEGETDSLPTIFQDFDEREIETMYLGSFDYERPLGDWGRLETGWKSIWERSDESRDAYIRNDPENKWRDDTLLSNYFVFNQHIHAIYGSLGWIMGNRWKAQAGVRLEQALTNGDAGEPFENNYFSVFPSGFLTYKATPTQEIQLSYTQRINRPSEWALNPMVRYDDPLNLRSGNPKLRPEYIHSSELSYIWYYPGGSVTSALYYQYATDIFTRFRHVRPDNTTLTTFENLNERIRMGGEFTASGKFTSWLSGQANVNLFQTYIQAENLQEDLNQSGFSWFGRLSTNIQLPWKMKSQLTYFHRGAGPTGQGYMKSIRSMDIALARDFLGDKLNVSLRLSDVFNTRQFEFNIDSEQFNQELMRKRESRIFFVNLTYRFGTDRNKRERERERSPGGEEMMDDM